MRITLGDHIVEINERTTTNNQHRVLTSSQKGIVSQDEYFNKQIASKENTGYKIVKRGQFTYRAMSATGRFYINRLMEYDVGIVSPAYPVFEVIEDNTIYTPYIVLFFESDYFQSLIVNQSTGSTRVSLKLDKIKRISIDIPSYQEQKEIVEKIESVKRAIAARDEQLSCFNELVKSRFIELFGDPIRNEKGWPIVTLGEVAEIRIGPFGSLLHKEDYIVGGHALVNPSHIIDGNICTDDKLTVSDEKYEELSAYRLSIGDLVLGRRGEMGRCAVVYEDGLLCGTGSIIIRPKEKMKPYFLQNIISSPGYKRIIEDKAVGVTMMNLNVPIVSSLTIPLLPIDMQERFIVFMQQTDKSKLAVQKALEELEILKKSLMQQYFG